MKYEVPAIIVRIYEFVFIQRSHSELGDSVVNITMARSSQATVWFQSLFLKQLLGWGERLFRSEVTAMC